MSSGSPGHCMIHQSTLQPHQCTPWHPCWPQSLPPSVLCMYQPAGSILLYPANLHNSINSQFLCEWFSRPSLRFLSPPDSREQTRGKLWAPHLLEAGKAVFKLGSWENETGMTMSHLLPFLTSGDLRCPQTSFPSHTSSQLRSLPWGQGATSLVCRTEIHVPQASGLSPPPPLPQAWGQGSAQRAGGHIQCLQKRLNHPCHLRGGHTCFKSSLCLGAATESTYISSGSDSSSGLCVRWKLGEYLHHPLLPPPPCRPSFPSQKRNCTLCLQPSISKMLGQDESNFNLVLAPWVRHAVLKWFANILACTPQLGVCYSRVHVLLRAIKNVWFGVDTSKKQNPCLCCELF